jgi:hypothetical protein
MENSEKYKIFLHFIFSIILHKKLFRSFNISYPVKYECCVMIIEQMTAILEQNVYKSILSSMGVVKY